MAGIEGSPGVPRRRRIGPTAFATSEMLREGAGPRRLRDPEFTVPSRGVRMVSSVTVEPLDVYRAFGALDPDTYISHTSAAHAWGIWLPPRFQPGFPVHLTRQKDRGSSPVRRMVVGHRAPFGPEDIREVGGIRLLSPAWTWTDLVAAGLSLEELVAAGDALLQRADGPPRPGGVVGSNPLATLAEMRNVVARRRGINRIGVLREALGLVRPRVDSWPESMLRQFVMAAGFPEPDVNTPVALADGRVVVPDLQYRGLRIAIQYEGRHHDTEARLGRDIQRDFSFEAIGWITVRADRAIFTHAGLEAFLDRLQHAVDRRRAEGLAA